MKNKIFIISFIFILLSFICFNNSVFADTADSSEKLIIDGYDMSDVYNYFSPDDAFYIFCYKDWVSYQIFKPDGNGYNSYNAVYKTKVDNNEDRTVIGSYNDKWEVCERYDVYAYNIKTNKFEYKYNGTLNGDTHTGCINIKYSSKGIYNEDHKSFFFKTPPTLLAQKLEKVEMTQEITTTLVGLAKYLIPLLVSLLAFWKAWQILCYLLGKA